MEIVRITHVSIAIWNNNENSSWWTIHHFRTHSIFKYLSHSFWISETSSFISLQLSNYLSMMYESFISISREFSARLELMLMTMVNFSKYLSNLSYISFNHSGFQCFSNVYSEFLLLNRLLLVTILVLIIFRSSRHFLEFPNWEAIENNRPIDRL